MGRRSELGISCIAPTCTLQAVDSRDNYGGLFLNPLLVVI